MKDGNKLKKYIPCLAALLLAGMTLALFAGRCKSEEKEPAEVVLLGDSIIGRQAETADSYDLLSRLLHASVSNCAFGGNRASLGADSQCSDNMADSLCLVNLTESICRNDFGAQSADIVSNLEATRVNYFWDHLNNLKRVDFNKTKVMVLEFGTNDYNSGHPVDNSENPYDCYSFGGALRYSLDRIQATYPDVQIILVTPTFSRVGGELCTEADFGGGFLSEYADKIKEIGASYNLPVVDAYTDTGIDETNVDEMTLDGIHLSEEGHAIYCNLLADTIKQYL